MSTYCNPHRATPRRRAPAFLHLSLGLLLAACAGEGERATHTVRDSAGVVIVDNSGPQWPEGGGWRVADEPRLDIGVLEGDPHYQFDRVAGALRLSDGRIVVANAGTGELRFYDAAGRFLSASGRKGGGPGEFEGMAWLRATAGDSLLTYDYQQRRMSLFDPQGHFIRSFVPQPLAGTAAFPRYAAPFADGSLLLVAARFAGPDGGLRSGVSRDTVLYLRCDGEGATLDTMGSFVGDERYMKVDEQSVVIGIRAFGHSGQTAVQGDGFYYGSSDRFEIGYYAADGALRQVIRLAQVNLSVTAQDIERFKQEQLADARDDLDRQLWERMLEDMTYPETMPAYGEFQTDAEGNLWVGVYRRPGDEQPRWLVFDPQGALLGTLPTPPRFSVYQIGFDFLLGRWRDELDVEHVRLYELRKGEVPR
jgi:hypothetical protein